MAKPEPTRAAGVIARSPQGRVLLVRSPQGWSWPTLNECGPRVGGLTPEGDDEAPLTVDVADEFMPRLSDEHSGWSWLCPEAVLEMTGPEEEEQPEAEQVDSRLAKALADNVEALGARMALFDAYERLDP